MSDPVFIVSALHRELYLNVLGASTESGGPLIVWRRTDHPNQNFSFTGDSIVCAHSGLALTAVSPVVQSNPSDSPEQRWRYDPIDQTIRSLSTDLVLDLKDNRFVPGTEVVLAKPSGSHSQKWHIFSVSNLTFSPDTTTVYKIQSVADESLVVEIAGLSKTAGASARVAAENGFLNQLWTVEKGKIKNFLSQLVLGALPDGSIVQEEPTDAETQSWGIDCDGEIRQNGLVVEVSPDGLKLANSNGEARQRFRFVNVGGGFDLNGPHYYYIQTGEDSDLVIGAAPGEKDRLTLVKKARTRDQLWIVEGGRVIRSVATGMRLAVDGPKEAGARLILEGALEPRFGATIWVFAQDGRIGLLKQAVVLAVRGGNVIEGAEPIIGNPGTGGDQKWLLVRAA